MHNYHSYNTNMQFTIIFCRGKDSAIVCCVTVSFSCHDFISFYFMKMMGQTTHTTPVQAALHVFYSQQNFALNDTSLSEVK